jgi:hypothetical protein
MICSRMAQTPPLGFTAMVLIRSLGFEETPEIAASSASSPLCEGTVQVARRAAAAAWRRATEEQRGAQPLKSPGAGRRPLSPYEEAMGERHAHNDRPLSPPLFHV